MKFITVKFILLLLCCHSNNHLFAQSPTNYTPYSIDSVKLLAIKKAIHQKYLKDSASIGDENKKQLIGIYRERYQNMADMFEEKEFLSNPDTDDYLNKMVTEIFKSNPQLNQLGTRFLFSRAFWPNAFSSGEGSIVFNIGLFTKLQNESQVAFVLCHELAHLYLDHSSKSIVQYVNTINSREFQQELKDIKKSKYQRNSQLEKLEKGMVFKSRRHGREHESEADAIGISYMFNTGYDVKEALAALTILDDIDKERYDADLGLQRHFNFAEYAFKKKWLKKETDFFGGVTESLLSTKEKDSLKTHPDCKARIVSLEPRLQQLTQPAAAGFLQDKDRFLSLQNNFKFELVEFCFASKRLSRCLYYALELLETNPGNAYLLTTIGKCFNEFYSNQKNHTLNRVVDLPSPYAPKNYDALTQFIQNISINDMAALGYYFLNRHKTQLAGDAAFEKTLAISLKNLNDNKSLP